ncbi:MAG: response regulator transcription factor [Desulfobacterales bacterium]|nr:response regulator transcription factor [Desulfobacterales bacterium]MDX2513028.1 response regulator transcription factor [Desulfobacterales bacterium]
MEPNVKKRVLVIEDDNHIAEGLNLNLSLQGYEVGIAMNGVAGLQMWREWRPDLIVLDIMLPGIDGLSILRNIRLEDEKIPILILSAKAETDYKVKGLAYGVDDYLTKPFSLEEFLLRVDRLLKRAPWSNSSDVFANGFSEKETNFFTFGDNQVDFKTMTATGKAGKVRLTEQEARLLKLFLTNPGKPLSRDKLLQIGWGYTKGTTTRTVDNFIVRFRQYFEDNPKTPSYFISIRSIGYVFYVDPVPDKEK